MCGEGCVNLPLPLARCDRSFCARSFLGFMAIAVSFGVCEAFIYLQQLVGQYRDPTGHGMVHF